MFYEHYCEYSNGVGVLLEDVQLTVSGDAGVRAAFVDSAKRGIIAWSIANNSEAHQRAEAWA